MPTSAGTTNSPAPPGTGSTPATQDPWPPQPPSALSVAPWHPWDSQALQVPALVPFWMWPHTCPCCPHGHIPCVPLSMYPLFPCPLCPPALSPLSPWPHPQCPPFPSLCPHAAHGPLLYHPTLRTLSASNPSAQREPRARDSVEGHGTQGVTAGAVPLLSVPSPGDTGRARSFVPSSLCSPSPSSAPAAAEPRLQRAPGRPAKHPGSLAPPDLPWQHPEPPSWTPLTPLERPDCSDPPGPPSTSPNILTPQTIHSLPSLHLPWVWGSWWGTPSRFTSTPVACSLSPLPRGILGDGVLGVPPHRVPPRVFWVPVRGSDSAGYF